MTRIWTLPEKQLVAELAAGIARRLTAHLAKDDEGYYDHDYMPWGESGCDILWRLGVARAWCGPNQKDVAFVAHGRDFPPCFRIFDTDTIRKALSRELPESSPPLDEILWRFIYVAGDLARDGRDIRTSRDWFVPKRECTREVQALERLGYIERSGENVRWTEKAATTMNDAIQREDPTRAR